MANVFELIKCISLNNKQCMARSTFLDLNLDEYKKRSCYYTLWLIKIDVTEVVILLMVYSKCM